MNSLLKKGKIHESPLTVNGKTIKENYANSEIYDNDVILSYHKPLMKKSGFKVLEGNICEAAIMKISVISDSFRKQYLSKPGNENVFEVRAIVFEGPEDYDNRINDPELNIDRDCILVIRGCGPVGNPGSAEVVNMPPPAEKIRDGIYELPTLGDGRQSGTSGSPSILNVSPESAIGGALLIVKTGDKIKIDLNKKRIDLLISDKEIENRKRNTKIPKLDNQTPWQEISRSLVGQLETGACLETKSCLLYTSPSPRDATLSRMPSSA